MHRRSLDRGHWIVVVGAVLLIVGGFLHWWQQGAAAIGSLPVQSSGPGLSDGRGLLVFLAGLAALMLIALPYATDGPVAIDRTASYLLLLVLGVVAYVWRAIDILMKPGVAIVPPTLAPGFWLAAIGLIVFARGVFEIHEAGRPQW